MAGTVNVSRDLWDDTTFKDSEMSQREAWIWMIAEASWKARDRRFGTAEISLQRGQLAASSRFMAKAWMWSEPRVRRYLDMLENRRMISRVTDAGVTVITICKYDEYQNGSRVSDAPSTQQPTQDRRTTDANDKKGERREEGKKEDTDVSSVAVDPEAIPDDVAQALDAYRVTAVLKGWPVPSAMNPTRRRAISARVKDAGGIEGWIIAIGKAADSDFLGQPRPFSGFGIDWIAKPANFTKIMEGNYDARSTTCPSHRRTSGSSFPGRSGQPGGLVGAAMRSRSGTQH